MRARQREVKSGCLLEHPFRENRLDHTLFSCLSEYPFQRWFYLKIEKRKCILQYFFLKKYQWSFYGNIHENNCKITFPTNLFGNSPEPDRRVISSRFEWKLNESCVEASPTWDWLIFHYYNLVYHKKGQPNYLHSTLKQVTVSSNFSTNLYSTYWFIQKFGFIKRVDKGWISTVKDLERWRFER